MRTRNYPIGSILVLLPTLLLQASLCLAGVSREIQERYRQKYVNRALFLKIPVFSERGYVYIRGRTFASETPPAGTPRFKVSDQVRILAMDFGSDEIKVRFSTIGGAPAAELVFKFDAELQENFPNQQVFDSALDATFTEGLRYDDIEDARRGHAQEQFDRAVDSIAAASGASRESVLQFIAPRLPAYQDAMRDLDILKKRNQDLTLQAERLQSENREMQAELRNQQNETARLRALNSSLQEKADSSTSQLMRAREDLRSAQTERGGYQKELAGLQRLLRLRTDSTRGLAAQIAEITQATQGLQRERDERESQNRTSRADLEKQAAANDKLTRQVDDLNSQLRKNRETITTLTSKEDSLARQYVALKQVKDNLENFKLAAASLKARILEERAEGGMRRGKADVVLADTRLGTLEWRLPEYLAPKATGRAELRFSSESVDFVRVAPSERSILQSLGDRLNLQAALEARTGAMDIKPEQSAPLQAIGERDQAAWHWQVTNQGTEDAWLALDVELINKNADAIPLWRLEQLVISATLVRQARNFLQPIPLALGVLIGFLLFAIVGVFRRAGRRTTDGPPHAAGHATRKGL